MKKIKLMFFLILLFASNIYAQYDPPIGYTSYYHLRLWGEGDRPGADSVNRNLIDIDLYLKNVRLDSLLAHRIILNSLELSIEGLTGGIVAERNRVNDSLTNHRIFMNTLRVEFDNVAGIVGLLDDSSSAYSQSIKQIKDTLYNRVPRLSLDNYFSGVNSSTHLTVSDNGSNALLQFDPGHLHNSLVKSGTDTILSAYNNGVTTPGIWNFTNSLNVSGTLKENNVQGHLISDFGSTTLINLWVADHEGGTANVQMRAVPVTINGNTVYLIYYVP